MTEASAETARHNSVAGDRPRDISDENVMDGQRITVRIPPSLCEDLDRLVEEGPIPSESEIVRIALRQLTSQPDAPLETSLD